MEHDTQLFVDSVACRYGSKMVLSSVFVNCRRGEVVGLLGLNGAGKSSLMKVIFGGKKGYYKHCELDGKLFQVGYRTRGIAYLTQEPLVPGYVTVGLAINLSVNLYTKQLLDNAIVRDNLSKRMGNLSGGMRRVIEALIVLYSDAPYVLLDEPYANMAPVYIDEINNHIEKLRPHKGFIVTDHYYDRILDISDRIVLIHNGCNYQIDGREDLRTHGYIPSSAFE